MSEDRYDEAGAEDRAGAEGLRERLSAVSRRAFLRRGVMTVGVASALSAVPGLGGMLAGAETDAPAVGATVSEIDGAAVSSTSPLVAHITDLSTGRMSVYLGEREVVYEDRDLAGRILRAAGR